MAVTWDQSNDGNNLVYTNGDLTVGITVDADWEQTLATLARSTGKYYFEVETVSNPGIAANTTVGVQNGSESLNSYIGDSTNGWGYQSNGRYYNSLANTGNPTWSTGGTVMVAVDLDNNKIWFGLNGTWDGDPAAGTGEAYSNLSTGDIYPAASPYHSYHTCTAHFVESDMSYSIPTGFSAWEEPITYDNSITFKIDGSKIDSNLTDFPVRLNLKSDTGPEDIDFSDVFVKLGSDYKKMSIQDVDGNEHYTEISYWSESTSAAYLDFKVPTLSAGVDTEFTLYYDGSVPDNSTYIGYLGDSVSQQVWDDNFLLVVHPNQTITGSSGDIIDSTGNVTDLTSANMESGDAGVDSIGPYLQLGGTNEYISSTTFLTPTTGEISVEAYFTTAGHVTNDYALISQDDDTVGNRRIWQFRVDNATGYVKSITFRNNTTSNVQSIGTVNVRDTVSYSAYTMTDTTNSRIYNEGVQTAISPAITPSFSTNTGVAIGRKGALYSGDYFIGKIYEGRLSNSERSADWIKATNAGLKDTLLYSVETNIDITIDTDLQTLTATQLGSTVESLSSFSTDFSEYPLGTGVPSGWSEGWNTGYREPEIIEDNTKQLFIEDGSDGRYALFLDSAGENLQDYEILSKMKSGSGGGADSTRLIARATDLSGTSSSGYVLDIQTDSNTFYLIRYIGSSGVVLDSVSMTLNFDTWYWTRFQLQGSNLKLKIWEYDTDEPASWTIEDTDSSHTDGHLGVGSYRGDSYFDYFAYDADSNNWPIPVPSATGIDITIDTDLQTLTATQLGLSTSVSVVQDLNVLNQTVTQLGSTVDLISNPNISLDVLNRSLTQLNASITTSYTAELNSLELTVEPETPMVCIGSTIDLNTLTLTKTQPSATLVIDPDVFINLNTLQQQLIINSVTLGIINKIIFPITNGLDDESGTSITNGLERSHNPNTFTGGLTRTSNPTTFTKGLELVKRE